MPLKWSKKMSRTDAQQRTQGYPVPYLRFTQSRHPQSVQTWFRQVFFAGAHWKPGFFGENPVEEAHVPFRVTINGVARGMRSMMVTHDGNRQQNHNTPNTYLHYDAKTRAELEVTNMSGRTVTVERDDNGVYHFTV